jgi:hypothetical protein
LLGGVRVAAKRCGERPPQVRLQRTEVGLCGRRQRADQHERAVGEIGKQGRDGRAEPARDAVSDD